MSERDPRHLAAGAVAALVLVLLAAWYVARPRTAQLETSTTLSTGNAPPRTLSSRTG